MFLFSRFSFELRDIHDEVTTIFLNDCNYLPNNTQPWRPESSKTSLWKYHTSSLKYGIEIHLKSLAA